MPYTRGVAECLCNCHVVVAVRSHLCPTHVGWLYVCVTVTLLLLSGHIYALHTWGGCMFV